MASTDSPSSHPSPPALRGFFVAGTDTGIGKTVVAGALAAIAHRRRLKPGVMKPVATGCRSSREGLISEDAEFLAGCADSVDPMSLICPCPYPEPLSPHLAARRAGRPVDFDLIRQAWRRLSAAHGFLVVEGAGGLLTPLSDRKFVADLAAEFALPLVLVTDAKLGTLTRTGTAIESARARKIPLAGVIVNRYDADSASVAEETAAGEIERVFRLDVLAVLPDDPTTDPARAYPGKDVLGILDKMDWISPAR